MKCIIAFFTLGAVFGFMLNVNSFLSSTFANKISRIVIDIFTLICFSFVYFSFMLAYNNGTFLTRHLLLTILGLLLYFLTIYRPINIVFDFIGGKLNSTVKIVLKKLKFGKKYCKKLLHNNGK